MPKILCDLQIACDNTCGETGNLPTRATFQHWLSHALASVPTAAEVTVRLVNEAESFYLNGRYRGQQHATNVLSFPSEAPLKLTPRLLGDLVICRQVIECEALAQRKPLMAHWAHMVVHGSLHLLGYQHRSDQEAEHMESLESAILKTLGYADPYFCEKIECAKIERV